MPSSSRRRSQRSPPAAAGPARRRQAAGPHRHRGEPRDRVGGPVPAVPDVETADLRRESDGTYTLAVTISSPYDTPERYADGWRVLGPDGEVLGTHELAHDHAGEQPFTRTQTGLVIPDGVDEVRVEGRDLEHGYGGTTVVVAVPAKE